LLGAADFLAFIKPHPSSYGCSFMNPCPSSVPRFRRNSRPLSPDFAAIPGQDDRQIAEEE
jgi:hypothetical protein